MYTWRMPSDHFIQIQNALRNIKSQHGVDLLNPRGVTIGDKPYPAITKRVWTDMSNDAVNHGSNFLVQIPFESGNRLSIRGGHQGFLESQVLVPTIHLNSNGEKRYWHGPAFHLADDSQGMDQHYYTHTLGNPNRKDIHETISHTSSWKSQGTYDWMDTEGFNKFKELRPYATIDPSSRRYNKEKSLNQEELAEHLNNFVFDPKHGPSNVFAMIHNGERATTDYHYDVLTEKLHQVNE